MMVLSSASELRFLKSEFIVEFGGGYGCLCHSVHGAGFKGRYVIFDLPVFTAVQTFYLRSNYLSVRDLGTEEGQEAFRLGSAGVYTVGDANQLSRIAAGLRGGVLIGMWSLTEAAPKVRRTVIDPLIEAGLFDAILLGLRDEWGGTCLTSV